MVITTNGHFRTCSVARKECRHNKLWNNFSLTCDLEKNEPGRFRTKKFSMKLSFTASCVLPNVTRPGLVLGKEQDLNQKRTLEVQSRSKLTKFPEQEEEQKLK